MYLAHLPTNHITNLIARHDPGDRADRLHEVRATVGTTVAQAHYLREKVLECDEVGCNLLRATHAIDDTCGAAALLHSCNGTATLWAYKVHIRILMVPSRIEHRFHA